MCYMLYVFAITSTRGYVLNFLKTDSNKIFLSNWFSSYKAIPLSLSTIAYSFILFHMISAPLLALLVFESSHKNGQCKHFNRSRLIHNKRTTLTSNDDGKMMAAIVKWYQNRSNVIIHWRGQNERKLQNHLESGLKEIEDAPNVLFIIIMNPWQKSLPHFSHETIEELVSTVANANRASEQTISLSIRPVVVHIYILYVGFATTAIAIEFIFVPLENSLTLTLSLST